MIRCSKIPTLSFMEKGGLLFEVEEEARHLTVDSVLSTVHEYTGNGIINGWNVTAVSGLDVAVAIGIGVASGVFIKTSEVTSLSLPDDETSYIYARLDGSELWDVSAADYDPEDATIEFESTWEPYCARIATVITSGGEVISITMEEVLSELKDLYELGKAVVDAHHHDDDPITKIDLGSEVTGLLPWWMIEDVPTELITGVVGIDHIPVLDHIGLLVSLDVDRSIALRQLGGKIYSVTSVWPIGVVPTVWRNGVVADDSEYTYDQTTRVITFVEVQSISIVIEIASDYILYTGSVDDTDREDVVTYLYKNGKINTIGEVIFGDGVVTVTFSSTQGRDDVFVLMAENYSILDVGGTYHRDLDDAVSTSDAFGKLGQTEVLADIFLQNLLSESHLYDISYLEGRRKGGGLELIDLGGDGTDITAGSINHLYPAWAEGEHYRTKVAGGDLVLDNGDWSIGLAMDQSGSMMYNDPTDIRIQAAKDLVLLLLSASESCEFYVEGFDTTTHKYGGWSNVVNDINNWLDLCITTDGVTDIYGALHGMWEELVTLASSNCKATIIFTDGIQTVESDYTLASVLSEYIALGYPATVPIICVGLSPAVDATALLELADGTEGVFFYCSEASQMLELSEYIVSDISNAFNTGYWFYEHSFDKKKTIKDVSISADYSTGCNVYLRYSTSEDEITWSEDIDVEFVAGVAAVDVCATYWRLSLVFLGSEETSPSVHSMDISYIEPGSTELWSNTILVSMPLFETQISYVISPFPKSLVEVGVWYGGDETWANCQQIISFEEIEVPNKLWRGLFLGPYTSECKIVFRFTNRSKDVMTVHDLAVLYNFRGSNLQ